MDLFGPVNVQTIAGKTHHSKITSPFQRMLWVLSIVQKAKKPHKFFFRGYELLDLEDEDSNEVVPHSSEGWHRLLFQDEEHNQRCRGHILRGYKHMNSSRTELHRFQGWGQRRVEQSLDGGFEGSDCSRNPIIPAVQKLCYKSRYLSLIYFFIIRVPVSRYRTRGRHGFWDEKEVAEALAASAEALDDKSFRVPVMCLQHPESITQRLSELVVARRSELSEIELVLSVGTNSGASEDSFLSRVCSISGTLLRSFGSFRPAFCCEVSWLPTLKASILDFLLLAFTSVGDLLFFLSSFFIIYINIFLSSTSFFEVPSFLSSILSAITSSSKLSGHKCYSLGKFLH
ncbi:hypothetical protein OSB04_011939 [Centaurea solstitialis]|uniref:Uncharacterized protein n=1 Tax=Centaurea solstitialis TaxID=347529 RepID=A0AA38TAF0_9ASTR|nr:hypothetical protein OSB04_011939 [Centaurea solstitialis]